MNVFNFIKRGIELFSMLVILLLPEVIQAHHVLGRPAYSLNEDSNTPPSMQVETQIGAYFLTYMVFPAFPKPNENGRINVYASRIDNGETFNGKMTFLVRNDNWFNDENEEIIGTQEMYDGVFRQGFLFKEKGSYIITAKFESGGEPYVIDFPLRIGETSTMGPIGIALGSIVFILIAVNIVHRKRLMREKIRSKREEL
ncbi:FIG00921845: hypothetical protein [hydrothermal vent metagenome]|uniref:Uncharacterized protein n=1 Tax=hydrothermal vent metagenome TaxID=652676 RepID=A0A3B0XJ16_9ZZZZ